MTTGVEKPHHGQFTHGSRQGMIFRQLIHDDLGCASYLVGDEREGIAAVVDPKLHIGDYLSLARYLGVQIEHVLETHNHADHVSGHCRLAAATGAKIHVHRLAEPAYPHEAFDDGWELRLGMVTVRAMHTPGHRPEHTAFALVDRARGPQALGRVDRGLVVRGRHRPTRTSRWTRSRAPPRSSARCTGSCSLLPGECEIWPGHLGGSLCGGPGMDMKVCSTIAYELAHNRALQLRDEDAFVRRDHLEARTAAT